MFPRDELNASFVLRGRRFHRTFDERSVCPEFVAALAVLKWIFDPQSDDEMVILRERAALHGRDLPIDVQLEEKAAVLEAEDQEAPTILQALCWQGKPETGNFGD